MLSSHPLLQSSHTPSPCSVTSQPHQKERFTRRHSVNVPPLPLEPEDRLPPQNRVTKRVTMDFSLLSVPLPDLPQDRDSDNHKQAAGQREDGNHEENIPIQVFCVTFVTSPPETFGYNCAEFSIFGIYKDSVNNFYAFGTFCVSELQLIDQNIQYSVVCRYLYNTSKILPKVFF